MSRRIVVWLMVNKGVANRIAGKRECVLRIETKSMSKVRKKRGRAYRGLEGLIAFDKISLIQSI